MDKFPFLHQLDSNDCGPTCIRMICKYYQNPYSASTVKSMCNLTRVGATLLDIKSCLVQMGFETVLLKVTDEEVVRMPLPAVLYWKQEHFVVLYKVSFKKGTCFFHIADPAFGKIAIPQSHFQKAFLENSSKGIALLVNPTEAFYQKRDRKIPLYEKLESVLGIFQEIVGKYKKRFLTVLFLSILGMVLNWIFPLIFQQIIDKGINGKDFNLVLLLALCQFVLFFSYAVSNSLSNIVLSKMGFSIGITFLSNYLEKLIRLPISFFDVKATSDLIQLVDDQDNLKSFFTYEAINILFVATNFVAFSAILVYYNYQVFLIFLFFTLLCIGWFSFFARRRKMIDYLKFAVSSEGKSNIYELVMGMREIKINSAQRCKINNVKKTQEKINTYQLKDLYLNFYSTIGISSINKVKDIVVVVFCAYFVIKGEMTIGILMTITYLLGQLSEPVNRIMSLSRSFLQAKYSLDRLSEIQKTPDENSKKRNVPTIPMKGILLSGVSFKYPGTYNPYVLKDLNLMIPKGKVSAVVGTSGSGKTTLLKLLLSFYYPQEGDIYLDEKKMNTIESDKWREMCGIVMQDGYIFSGSIAENIAIADTNPDMGKVKAASQIACIDDFVETLPMKYNTRIGNRGIELSGGQKQRLLIARAVYKNPEFIFFDEATSFLDTKNEYMIMHNLKDFYQGKTVVIVAHRLSTVKDADNILVLNKGYLVEQGTHKELLAQKGHYYNLIKNQLELNT